MAPPANHARCCVHPSPRHDRGATGRGPGTPDRFLRPGRLNHAIAAAGVRTGRSGSAGPEPGSGPGYRASPDRGPGQAPAVERCLHRLRRHRGQGRTPEQTRYPWAGRDSCPRAPEIFEQYARIAASLMAGCPARSRLPSMRLHPACRFGEHGGRSRGEGDIAPRPGSAAYAFSRPAIYAIRRASISGSRPENGRKPNRS